jgi:hypothetical protein
MHTGAATWAEGRGLPFLSMVPAVLALPTEELPSLIIAQDGHPTKKGHRFIAAQLDPFLAEALAPRLNPPR